MGLQGAADVQSYLKLILPLTTRGRGRLKNGISKVEDSLHSNEGQALTTGTPLSTLVDTETLAKLEALREALYDGTTK